MPSKIPISRRFFKQMTTHPFTSDFLGGALSEAVFFKQYGKFKTMKSPSHMSPYLWPTSESLGIVVAQSCYEFVTSCRFISLYRQADSLFLFYLSVYIGLLETHTNGTLCTHGCFSPITGIQNSGKPVFSLFVESKPKD